MSHVDQDATAARPDRRAVIRGAGAVGLAAVGGTVLAACGSDSTAGATAGDTSTGGSSGGPSSAATTTTAAGGSGGSGGVAKADIPVGGGTIVAATKTVITQPAAGEFKAFSSICTHMGCPVASVADGTINCNCHGSRYDIATGAVKRGPATKPLPAKTVTVKGDQITVT
jgi:Rieske Fe-S protein